VFGKWKDRGFFAIVGFISIFLIITILSAGSMGMNAWLQAIPAYILLIILGETYSNKKRNSERSDKLEEKMSLSKAI
jgi:hypothetical protein